MSIECDEGSTAVQLETSAATGTLDAALLSNRLAQVAPNGA